MNKKNIFGPGKIKIIVLETTKTKTKVSNNAERRFSKAERAMGDHRQKLSQPSELRVAYVFYG